MRIPYWQACLAVFLIVVGGEMALSLTFDWMRFIKGGLLIGAGFLWLLGK